MILRIIASLLTVKEIDHNKHSFNDSSGNPLSNGCLVFPDQPFVFLDKEGQCEAKIVEEAKAVCIFDKSGNLMMEFGE